MPETVVRPSTKLVRLGYAVVLLVAVGVFFLEKPLHPSVDTPWLTVVALLLLLWPLKRHVQLLFTRMIVLDDRLQYSSGFLSKTSRSMLLSKVQDVRVDQSLGQRLFGMGTLSLESAGETGGLSMVNVDRPREVADRIMDAAHRAQQPPARQ